MRRVHMAGLFGGVIAAFAISHFAGITSSAMAATNALEPFAYDAGVSPLAKSGAQHYDAGLSAWDAGSPAAVQAAYDAGASVQATWDAGASTRGGEQAVTQTGRTSHATSASYDAGAF